MEKKKINKKQCGGGHVDEGGVEGQKNGRGKRGMTKELCLVFGGGRSAANISGSWRSGPHCLEENGGMIIS